MLFMETRSVFGRESRLYHFKEHNSSRPWATIGCSARLTARSSRRKMPTSKW
jgi:hypothetical protein